MELPISTAPLKTRLTALKERFQPRLRRILAIAIVGCTATGAVIRGVDG